MASQRAVNREVPNVLTQATRIQTVLAAAGSPNNKDDLFSVYSYALNRKPPETRPEGAPNDYENRGGIENNVGKRFNFPGNISPEGYFYLPFNEVRIKELDDELQYVTTKRINFAPSKASTGSVTTTAYDPETGVFEENKVLNLIIVEAPTKYDFMDGRPFSIYDADEDKTFRGHLYDFKTEENGACTLKIATEQEINEEDLQGRNTGGISRYYIAMLNDNAPEYAEYIPATNRLIWRGVKKMSELDSTSPLYNMPFTNGRHYIHRNINEFVRRQDPQGDRGLYRPSPNNPLRRFQIEGDTALDFDQIQYIIDSMVDAC